MSFLHRLVGALGWRARAAALLRLISVWVFTAGGLAGGAHAAVNATVVPGSFASYSYIAGKPTVSNAGDYNLPAGTNAQRPACTAALAGRERWNTGTATQEYCNGSNWMSIVASAGAGTVTANNGYFVMSAGSWTGNLGGLNGANALCLADLTNNDWRGKADAVSRGLLIASKTRAFLCLYDTCEQAKPLTSYVFGRSGSSTAGGAAFETDAIGNGPGNYNSWFGFNYFGSSESFWSYRFLANAEDNSKWGYGSNNYYHGYQPACGNWTSNDSAQTGATGSPLRSDAGRWRDNLPACNIPRKLICIVNP